MSPLERLRPFGLRIAVGGAAVLFAAAGLAAPAVGHPAGHLGSAAPQQHVGKAADTLTATLKGSNEVPGPGDPNGIGHVTIRLEPAAGKVCAHATWKRLSATNGAHIHKGRPGVSGPVIVDLTTAVTGGSHCRSNVPTTVIHKIAAHPGRYYFNIHTSQYIAGAIRGQLHG